MGTSDLENRTKGNCSSAMDRTVKKQKQGLLFYACARSVRRNFIIIQNGLNRRICSRKKRELCMYCNVCGRASII